MSTNKIGDLLETVSNYEQVEKNAYTALSEMVKQRDKADKQGKDVSQVDKRLKPIEEMLVAFRLLRLALIESKVESQSLYKEVKYVREALEIYTTKYNELALKDAHLKTL